MVNTKSKIPLLQLVANIVLVVKNLIQSLPIVSFIYNFFFVLSSLTNFNLQFFLYYTGIECSSGKYQDQNNGFTVVCKTCGIGKYIVSKANKAKKL